VEALVGPLVIVSAALVVAGIAKVRQPANTVAMFASVGLPRLPWLGRALGLVEIVAGVAAIALRGGAALGVAVLYAAFALLMLRLVLLGDAAPSCGCFGVRSARPSWVHVAADAVAASVAAAAVATSAPALADVLADQPALGLPYVAFLAIGTYAFVAVLTSLPDVFDAVRATSSSEPAISTFHLVPVRVEDPTRRVRPRD